MGEGRQEGALDYLPPAELKSGGRISVIRPPCDTLIGGRVATSNRDVIPSASRDVASYEQARRPIDGAMIFDRLVNNIFVNRFSGQPLATLRPLRCGM